MAVSEASLVDDPSPLWAVHLLLKVLGGIQKQGEHEAEGQASELGSSMDSASVSAYGRLSCSIEFLP